MTTGQLIIVDHAVALLNAAAWCGALVLDRGVAMVDGAPPYAQTVDGRRHPSIPDQLVSQGDLVRFTVVNRSVETHPWQLHAQSHGHHRRSVRVA